MYIKNNGNNVSMAGYVADIGRAQFLQRARRRKKLMIGMLSYHLTGTPQDGHLERGRMTERPSGIR
jgi:hypothetical protein